MTTSGGSHLEMQSRGIDSYAHAIHRFQYFDTGDVDIHDRGFKDPVFAKRYQLHIEHGFPNFTIKNCEACHVTSGSAGAGDVQPGGQHQVVAGPRVGGLHADAGLG